MSIIDTIEEENGNNGVEFKRYNGKTKMLSVRVKAIKKFIKLHAQDEGLEYFLLINSYGNIIPNAYNYLNYEIRNIPYKDREGALTALKHMYSFLELFYLSCECDINRDTINKFMAFLKGGKIETTLIFKGKTVRGNSTTQNYMSVYRKYFKYLKIDASIFEEEINIVKYNGGISMTGHAKVNTKRRYKVSSHMLTQLEVPKYISYEEYINCIRYINQRPMSYWINLRDIIIIHLMYEYGLRIGEVLGLTIEDFYNQMETGDSYGQLILRNRYTDKPWQFAKGCMKINSREDYKDPLYKQAGLGGAGYQIIQIEETSILLIEEYMRESVLNASLSSKLAYNLRCKNLADVVADRKDITKENKYMFVSKNLTPITCSGNGWNANLEGIFMGVGIPCDKVTKTDGLNHRFRHGFAMYKVMKEGCDLLKLKNALRHLNTQSCSIYFNPTQKDNAIMAHKSDQLLKNGGLEID